MTPQESHVFLHPDGYVEMVFVGMQETERLQKLIAQARALIDEHGSISVIIDGRNGRVYPSANNFANMMNMGRIPNLIQLYILTSDDPNNPEAIKGPSVITSILTSVLGFRPIYSSDEANIRHRASKDKGDRKIGK